MAKSGMSESDSDGKGCTRPAQTLPNAITPKTPSPPNHDSNNHLQNVEIFPTNDGLAVGVDNPIIQTSMPISIIIQSLVQNLCFNYEPDEKKAQCHYMKICDMLCRMMVIDDSYLMKEFEGIRNQCQRAFHHLLKSSPRGDTQTALTPMWSNDVRNEWSHYKREFEELAFIARGGFGRVYKVRHKLDDTEYAVKKIFIRSNSIESVRNYLAEVKTFASLNHSNIVQYKQAWLELGVSTSDLDNPDDESSDEEIEESEFSIKSKFKQDESETSMFMDTKRDLDISYDHEDSSDFVISFEFSRHQSLTNSTTRRRRRKEGRVKRNSASEGGSAICKIEEIKRLQTKHHPKWATLFIQMSLCNSTLKQWLETRNSIESLSSNALVPIKSRSRFETVIEILKQLLKGLDYIHSKNVVHHDVKPSNIFMQCECKRLLVQLGDFGLACPLQASQHSLACGTRLYAAPEQLKGLCNSKSDMYSLGIVVYELTETFVTDMERITNIENLRKGHIPETTLDQQPQLAEIVSKLVIRQPSDRPDASTLLKHIEDQEKHELQLICEMQRNQIAEKEEEILRLREILRLKDAQVAEEK